jgi:hypothetical protein
MLAPSESCCTRPAADGRPPLGAIHAGGTAVLPLDQEIAPEKIGDPIMVLSVND